MRRRDCILHNRRRRTAYTLVEVSMSTLMIGVLLIGAMNSAGYATRGQIDNKERAQAKLLANAMLAEILELPYQEPTSTPAFGPESGEVRATYDDVDDYKIFSDSPPVDKQGNALAGGSGLTRSVVVSYVEPNNLTATSSTDQGIKRIAVSVARSGKQLVSMTAVVVK
ncbi:MAG: hypothetical protein HYV60_24880 [Planctomycetia bacterium]|nr:hypothetical protein [Planctomycetia bacterium]